MAFIHVAACFGIICDVLKLFMLTDVVFAGKCIFVFCHLPAPNLSTSYVFATGDDFFAYPNNYNYYVSYYRNTFQHGGISMEEMIIPIINMKGRKR